VSRTSTKSLVRRVEALESTARKAAPQKRNLQLEMSITAMAWAWTPEEIEEMLAAAERSKLDEIPPDLRRAAGLSVSQHRGPWGESRDVGPARGPLNKRNALHVSKDH